MSLLVPIQVVVLGKPCITLLALESLSGQNLMIINIQQAEVELRLTQAEVVSLLFGYELSSLLNSQVSYEEEIQFYKTI